MHVMVKFILPNKHYQRLFFDSSSIIFIVLLLEQFLVGPTSNLPNNPWMQIRSWDFSLACADHQLGCMACFHSILFTQRGSASACLCIPAPKNFTRNICSAELLLFSLDSSYSFFLFPKYTGKWNILVSQSVLILFL